MNSTSSPAMSTITSEDTDDPSLTICLYVTGHDWDHYLIFAMTEINSGMYASTLGDNMTFPYQILYADPLSVTVEGEAQLVFSNHYSSCAVFVGPAWTSQLSAIGEWAGLERKPIVSGGATSAVFAGENFEYVSRSIPSEENVLEAFVQIIVEYEMDIINIVYANDDYGRSVTEDLIEMSKNLFQVQILRSFQDATDTQGINSILDDIEQSPTHVTFLAMTVLQLTDFLNTAGKRGMHDNHLWLSPTATQVAGELDPPSTGGIWGISYGEELTDDSELAVRYMTKDVTPHIDAMEYGLKDDYDVLSYWGAYGYDAVLAAAHGLAAAKNRSDGEQVLQSIRAVSLDNANTGLLEMDEHGDRIGARIPIFYIKDATAEEFAVYYNGNVDFVQAPLWPGGSTVQPPDLIRLETEQSNVAGLVMAIVLPLMALILVILGYLHWKARRSTRDISNAPKTSPCCLLFTDIQSSSTLWGNAPVEMSNAIDTHHSVIRSCLVSHGAYEVKTIGDSFMIACKNPDNALLLAIDMQEALFNAEWDSAIDACYRDMLENKADHDSSVWHGLRVRASIHYGKPEIQFDEAAKGYDYYGNMVNESARIEALAHGGQIVVSEAFKDALKNDCPRGEFMKLGEYELRGCPNKLNLFQLTPKKFEGRKFLPLRTGDAEKGNEGDDDSEFSDWIDHHDLDISSRTGSEMLGHNPHSKWLKTLLSVFKSKPRKEIMNKLLQSWHVRDEQHLVRRVTKVSLASERTGRSPSQRTLQPSPRTIPTHIFHDQDSSNGTDFHDDIKPLVSKPPVTTKIMGSGLTKALSLIAEASGEENGDGDSVDSV